jgi:hypothetical protein
MTKSNWLDPEFLAANAYKRHDGEVSELAWGLLSFFAESADVQLAYASRGACTFNFFLVKGVRAPNPQANYLFGLSRTYVELHRFLSNDFDLPPNARIDQLTVLLEEMAWMDIAVWTDAAVRENLVWELIRQTARAGLDEIGLPLSMLQTQLIVEDYVDPPYSEFTEPL